MNQMQLEYDVIVQTRNKEITFDKLKRTEKKLKQLTRTIWTEGQMDKARNRRQHTLYEYREAIADFEKRQKRNARKIKYLSHKIKPPKNLDRT